jgi:hypothetical protein
MAVRVYLRGMCVLVFLACRGVVAVVSVVARHIGRQPHDPRDDEFVLAA